MTYAGPPTDMTETFAYVKSLYAVEEVDTTPLFFIASKTGDVDLKALARSPKAIHKKATEMAWHVNFIETVTRHRAVYLEKDGATVKKDGTKSLKGDLKSEAKDVRHLFMHAQDPSGQVGFRATWKDNSFIDVLVRDPYGIQVELYFDYEPDHLTKNARGDKNANEIADTCDAAYNDGTMVKTKRKVFGTAARFNEWLDFWLLATGHEVKKKAPKKAPKPEVSEMELLAGAEWQAKA